MVNYILFGLVIVFFLISGKLFSIFPRLEWLDMSGWALVLSIINIFFLIDIIFLNSFFIKKARSFKKTIPSQLNKIIDKIKTIIYKNLFNDKDQNGKFYNENFSKNNNSDKINEMDQLKKSINIHFDKKPNFLLENYNPFITISSLKNSVEKLTLNEFYLLETIKKTLDGVDYDLITKNDLAHHYIEISKLLTNYESIRDNYERGMKQFYSDINKEMNTEIKKFRRLNEVLKNSKTSHVYLQAERQYSMAFYIYSGLGIITIAGIMKFSLFIIEQKSYLKTNYSIDNYDYWALKITSIFIFITLITFFIKQAVHYQKKKDQAERTRLELDALPTYIFDFEDADIKSIRKELIPKYFGNNNDNSTLNEIGNIVTEQLKTSSDVAKSSAEIIKALKIK
ncbi:hypothetical protein [Acinetobacter silvestris]|uniref:Uncharacterized protein n=1 Tax=Acinetobacter silvestris TaxID=1977882 RepID=A0A1Y3CFQ5_9GAMM|nr:hypothetical protein [Acinetobacter silvestris]OTG65941.1 hypothetical protein B9T28_07010 [Acinetobacter silvestris]